MKFRSLKLIFFVLFAWQSQAQVTTSGLSGIVFDAQSAPLIGATVKIINDESGSVYGTVTNENGRFYLENVRSGGPYSLQITSVGSESHDEKQIYLTLGETTYRSITLSDANTIIDEVVIVGNKSRVFNKDRTGAATNITNQTLNKLPTLSRSISDMVRLTPQSNGNNFAGRDGRFNNLQVDGSNLNNGFGLSNDPLPGGGNQPISLDAFEEIQVNIAPYDVRQTGFTGAGINAVTRSGSNKISGSAYVYLRPKTFTGLVAGDVLLSKDAAATSQIYGARIGGPIIKNKLFYFVNFEYENRESVGNNWRAAKDSSEIGKPNVSRTLVADLERVSQHLKSKYNYDPGAYEGYANTYNNKNYKALARIDWNINEKNKFSFRYSIMDGTNDQATNFNSGPSPRSSTGRIGENSIAFENANYSFKNTVNSVALELNTKFNNVLTNQLLATYSSIKDKRITPGNLFPFVDIGDGSNTFTNYMSFGSELFSTNNEVINDNIILTDNITYNLGINSFTAGVSFQTLSFKNSFQRLGSSYYRYKSVDDFINDAKPTAYGVTYLLKDQDRFAKINFGLGGLYLQDKIALTQNINVTAGIRIDIPLFLDNPPSNPTIDSLKLLDKSGVETTYSTKSWPSSKPLFSPRIGFNWDIFSNRTLQVRGGTGIFSGNLPFVWFTNMPTNAGVIQNTLEPVKSDVLAKITSFNPDPSYWPSQLPQDFPATASTKAPGSIALIDSEFKMPQVWRSSFGFDYKIGASPLILTADAIYTKEINGIYQFNANRKAATDQINFENDHRDYWGTSTNAIYNNSTGATVAVLSNTNKGYSFSGSIGLGLTNYHGLSGNVFYTFTKAEDVTGNPGSSASSAWINNYSVNDPNELLLGNSQYAVPHRVGANITYTFDFGSSNRSYNSIGLFYNGTNPGRFALTYSNDINADGVTLDLLYIPNDISAMKFDDIKNSAGDVLFTADQQKVAFESLVNKYDFLSEAKGDYVKRNSGIMPWLNRFDVKFVRGFELCKKEGAKKHNIELSLDIFNVANLFNREWGISPALNTGGSFNYSLLKANKVDSEGVPSFQLTTVGNELPKELFRDNASVSSTYGMQLGIRYNF